MVGTYKKCVACQREQVRAGNLEGLTVPVMKTICFEAMFLDERRGFQTKLVSIGIEHKSTVEAHPFLTSRQVTVSVTPGSLMIDKLLLRPFVCYQLNPNPKGLSSADQREVCTKSNQHTVTQNHRQALFGPRIAVAAFKTKLR